MTDFRTGSLKQCKAESEKFYYERMKGFESGDAKFFYPFESPSNFKQGKNSAYSLVLSIVEYYFDNEYYEYPLLGEDEQTCADSREIEASVLKGEKLYNYFNTQPISIWIRRVQFQKFTRHCELITYKHYISIL